MRQRRLDPGGGLAPGVAEVGQVGQVQRDVRGEPFVHARLSPLPVGAAEGRR